MYIVYRSKSADKLRDLVFVARKRGACKIARNMSTC